jgi:hypothetical protein
MTKAMPGEGKNRNKTIQISSIQFSLLKIRSLKLQYVTKIYQDVSGKPQKYGESSKTVLFFDVSGPFVYEMGCL